MLTFFIENKIYWEDAIISFDGSVIRNLEDFSAEGIKVFDNAEIFFISL